MGERYSLKASSDKRKGKWNVQDGGEGRTEGPAVQ